MVYEIVLGRSAEEKERLGSSGAVFLGKHYIKMGAVTALSNPIYLDVNKSHVVFVVGKRGSGKSYSISVIAEGIATLPPEFSQRLSVIMFDTMGIFWTMKYPNHKDEALLKEWDLEGKGIDVKVYVPFGFFKEFRQKGIDADYPFSLNASELSPEDWNTTFELNPNSQLAVFIERLILTLKKEKEDYDVDDVLVMIEKDEKESVQVKRAATNRFLSVKEWGVFRKESTPVKELAEPGQVSILDLSAYALMPNGWKIKHVVTGIVCKKLFMERLAARKSEEYEAIHSAVHYIVEEEKPSEMPIVWIMLDEAHEFIPNEEKTASTDALTTLLREGRQPGIALVLASQQPAKIHTDVMTQSDVLISHRLTAKIDTDSLGSLMQSYLRQSLDKELNLLPRVAGAALALDDVNERLYPMRVRPRFSWHGGSAPEIIKEKKKIFEF